MPWKYEDYDVWKQAQLIAYDQVRGYEEGEEQINMYKALGAKV